MPVFVNRSVIPSYLSSRSMGADDSNSSTFNTTQLLEGEVKKIIYPSSPQSVSKKYIEYVVDVQYKRGREPASIVTFPSCLLMSQFGGVADTTSYTLRADPRDPHGDEVVGDGSRVLMLCIAGDIQRAYILGGIRDDDFKDSKEDGHNLYFSFNGVTFKIDKDGQPTLMFNGATKASGEIADSADKNASGTNIAIAKDGSLTVATPESDQQILLNHTDKSIEIVARDQFFLQCGGTSTIETTNKIDIKSNNSNINMNAGSFVDIQSQGVHVGTATDAWVKGTTYRTQETLMHTQIQSMLATLSGLISTAGASLTTAAALHVVPVVGSTLGAPAVAAAATALTAAGPIFAALSSAIAAFEAQSMTYLSTKNLTD